MEDNDLIFYNVQGNLEGEVLQKKENRGWRN